MGEYLTLVDTTNEEYIKLWSSKHGEIIRNKTCQRIVTAFTLRNAHREEATICWVGDEYGPKELQEKYYDEYDNATVDTLEYLFESNWKPPESYYDWILKQYKEAGKLELIAERIPKWSND